MSRIIDADKLHYHKVVINATNRTHKAAVVVFAKEIDKAEIIDAVPVVHGRWKQRANGEVYCSHCNCNVGVGNLSEVTEEENYCYNCGADMRGTKDELQQM